VTKSGFNPKVEHFFFRINFPSSHLSVCCGYLIESGAFEIFLQAMLLQIADFVGQLSFLKFCEYIFESILKNLPNH